MRCLGHLMRKRSGTTEIIRIYLSKILGRIFCRFFYFTLFFALQTHFLTSYSAVKKHWKTYVANEYKQLFFVDLCY